jgi:lactoylglutathione lyase
MTSHFKPTFFKATAIKIIALAFVSALPFLGFSQNTANTNQPVFNHAALCAHNLKKTAAFYTDVMQLQTIHHPFNDTVHVWLKIGDGLALHIIQGQCPTTVHDIGIHLCFAVPSLDDFIKHLEALNVPYVNWTGQAKKIQVRADGVRQIYIQDPDGFWIEVNDAK